MKIIGREIVEIDSNAIINNKDNNLEIVFTGNCNLEMNNIDFDEVKFIVKNESHIRISEIKDISSNIIYKLILETKSSVMFNRFYNIDDYNEKIIISLLGSESKIDINTSSIAALHHVCSIDINHLNTKTISNIKNHSITIKDGSIDLTVNGLVANKMSNSILNQDNKIIMMGKNKSTIKPNLFIEDNFVEARHGASIGTFNEDEMFYLESRGINKVEGYYLLMKGFLLGILDVEEDIKNEIINRIEAYRR